MAFYSADPVRFGSVSQVTATLGSSDPEVGTRTRVGDEDYIFVYNDGGEDISPGYGAIVSAVSGYSVTVSSITNIGLLVGVCKHATLTTATYGWLVTKGFCQVEMEADNSAAAGVLLTLADNGEFAHKSNATATGYQAPAYGQAMAAIASGASGSAYISVF